MTGLAPLVAKKPAAPAGAGNNPKGKPNVASRSPSKTVPGQQNSADAGREGGEGNDKSIPCPTHPIKKEPPMPPPRRVSHSINKVEAGEN